MFSSVFLGGVFWVLFTAAPVLLPFIVPGGSLALDPSYSFASFIVAFVACLILAIVLALVAYSKEGTKANIFFEPSLKQMILARFQGPASFTYFRFNGHNTNMLVAQGLEFVQLLSLVFVLTDLPLEHADQLRQSSKYQACHELFLCHQYALFSC